MFQKLRPLKLNVKRRKLGKKQNFLVSEVEVRQGSCLEAWKLVLKEPETRCLENEDSSRSSATVAEQMCCCLTQSHVCVHG